jgi:hypothetical protein
MVSPMNVYMNGLFSCMYVTWLRNEENYRSSRQVADQSVVFPSRKKYVSIVYLICIKCFYKYRASPDEVL